MSFNLVKSMVLEKYKKWLIYSFSYIPLKEILIFCENVPKIQ